MFGKDYIIPKPFDPRLIVEVPVAVAKAAMDSGVAREPISNWKKYSDNLMDRTGSGRKVLRALHHQGKTKS